MKNSIFLFILLSIVSYAQTKHLITSEDIWKMKRLSSLEVSPDLSKGVFIQTNYDIDENKGYSDLYLIQFSNNEVKRLTYNKSSEGSPKWDPKGTKIAFLAKREDDKATQIYILDLAGGEPERITDVPTGVSSIKWNSKGDKIFFAANVLPSTGIDFASLKKDVDKKKDKKVTARVTEDRFYRYWDHWLPEDYVTQIFSVDVLSHTYVNHTPDNKRLLSFDGSGADFDISNDGKYLAVAANVTLPPYTEPFNMDIFLLETGGKSAWKNISEMNLASDGAPTFSNDSKILYYNANTNPQLVTENNKISKYSIAEGTTKILTAKYDISCGARFFSEDGKTIYFSAEDKAKIGIFSIDADGNNFKNYYSGGQNDAIKLVGSESFSFINNTLNNPTRIVTFSNSTKRLTINYDPNSTIMDSIKLGAATEYYFDGAGGDKVQMYVVTPPDYDKNKKYGLLHIIHGGPHNASMDDFHPRWNTQRFAAMGYIVALVNFHGSSGFGEKFCSSILGAHGDKPYIDMMNATDFLLKNYPIDSTRMACAGGSYGGYLVNWIATQTTRFAALISHAGVYNLQGQFASDMTHFREIAYGGSPWHNPDKMMTYSPSKYVGNIKTPMLIIHGDKDARVVVTQGLELYASLKGNGIKARLINFPDENHWVLQPQNSIFWYKEFEEWLKRFIK